MAGRAGGEAGGERATTHESLKGKPMGKHTKPDCPKCAGSKTGKFNDSSSDHRYYCHQCHAIFDADAEMGDYSTDPTRRLQREEQDRRRGKGHGGRRS